jgi:hypothetical protein
MNCLNSLVLFQMQNCHPHIKRISYFYLCLYKTHMDHFFYTAQKYEKAFMFA